MEYDHVLRPPRGKLADDRLGEPSAAIRDRIEKAREVQRQRFAGRVGGMRGDVPLLYNGEMPALSAQARVWDRRKCASPAGWMMLARASCARPCP